MEDLLTYMKDKINDLREKEMTFPEEKLNEVYNHLNELDIPFEEKKAKIDVMYENALKTKEKELLNEKAKNGEYSNYDKIKEVINILLDTPLGNLITIYGSCVPYIISGVKPKRVIGDVDTIVKPEDIDKVREYIKSHPETFKIVLDSKDYTDDFGLEMQVKGIDVSIFLRGDTPEGRLSRNFDFKNSTDTLIVKETLFPGLTEENSTSVINFNGHNLRVECPEYVFIEKNISLREKDMLDIEVLKNIINVEKVEYLKEVAKHPEYRIREELDLNKLKKQVKTQ